MHASHKTRRATPDRRQPMSPLSKEIKRRRIFAIISHPDAGKTTLTEKLLLFAGAIHHHGESCRVSSILGFMKTTEEKTC